MIARRANRSSVAVVVSTRTLFLLLMMLMLIAGGARTASAQVTIKRKFDVKAYKQQSTNKLSQVMNVAGMDIESSMDSTLVQSYEVRPGKNGAIQLVEKTESAKMDFGLPMGLSFTFDSKNPKAATDNPQLQPLVEMIQGLTKTVFTYVIDPVTGKASSVEGGKALLESLSQQARALAEDQLQPDKLIEEYEDDFSFLPAKPVKAGDTWTKSENRSLGQGQTLVSEVVYTYAGTGNKDGKSYDSITGAVKSVKIKMEEGQGQGVTLSGSDLKVTKGTKSILFDREKGQLVESKSDIVLEGSVTLNANGMEIPATVKLNLDDTMTWIP